MTGRGKHIALQILLIIQYSSNYNYDLIRRTIYLVPLFAEQTSSSVALTAFEADGHYPQGYEGVCMVEV